MKNRSHRLPTSDPPDDWVDGSWTVDCICGVNFDDGEEMVNCDECGVWVHTRCSRYVKSEKSFACDKCKNRNARNDSEETEVAQLLVELPTKTLRMDNPYPSGGPPRRPFRLWTDIPIEERVHVQGIPGGEPALLGGLSTIFTPELWKCTGYVPKKFNFQYREFPCWNEKPEVNAKLEDENENPVDKGAGVLFSLSKESALIAPPFASIGVRRQIDDTGHKCLGPSKDLKKWASENVEARCGQDSATKDRAMVRPVVVHSTRRKKEDSATAKDAKKKARVVEREKESKKRAPQAQKTACTLSSDLKQSEVYEDRGPKSVKTYTHVDLKTTLPKDPSAGGHHMGENNVEKHRDNLAPNEFHLVALASDARGHNISVGGGLLEEKHDHQVSARTENSKTDDGTGLSLEHKDPGSVHIKEEEIGVVPDTVTDDLGGPPVNVGMVPHKSELIVEDFGAIVLDDNQSCRDASAYTCQSSVEPCARMKTEAEPNDPQQNFNGESSVLDDEKLNGTKAVAQRVGASNDQLSVNVQMHDTTAMSLQSSEPKMQDADTSAEAVIDCQMDTAIVSVNDPKQNKQQAEELEGSSLVRKSSSELKHDLKASEQLPKHSTTIVSPTAATSEQKLVTSAGKMPSPSSDNLMSKPSAFDNRKPSNAQSSNLKKWGSSDSDVNIRKEIKSNDVVRREDKHELPRKILKERSKATGSSVLKMSHSSKISSDPKRTMSDSKHSVHHSSSKVSSTKNVGVTSGCGESASSLQSQSASHVQNKISASGLPQKGDKFNQSNSQLSTKVNHSVPVHHPAPSNGPTTLSDEELALLLHQELNSSPRVPRVPRLRHTGSLPQIASPTATSILIKRTSSSGGSNHNIVARRKNKDSAKDGSRSSREVADVDDEAKTGRLPPSPDQKRHDSACTSDTFTKRESDNGSGKGLRAIKKSVPSASTATVSSGLSSSAEANEQNMSSMCNSPRNASDDDTGAIGGPAPHTLPGLIAEIMSKGKHMSYDELCNAVLPHWPNLRKHNGERYAYSSHSQAVLDCLRNRHEWAQLVDRGPKTGASRKRRKPDAESLTFESGDNMYGKDTASKDIESKSFESHREEFPKGKRKARKRRRLALEGRGIKDVRRRRKADAPSDEDVGSIFSSSDDSMFSDEEIQGGGAAPDGSEGSSSADEMGTS